MAVRPARSSPLFTWLLLGCAILLAGCPLTERRENTDSALRIVLSAPGLKLVDDDEYLYQLDTANNPENVLSLRATLNGQPVALATPPVSDDPKVVRVDSPSRLVALAAGETRVRATHGGQKISLTVKVTADQPKASGLRVSSPSLQDSDGQAKSIESDNYKYGNGGLAREPTIQVTISDGDVKPASGFLWCRNFMASVVPQRMANGQPAGSDQGTSISFDDTAGYGLQAGRDPRICSFSVYGYGFPIIGSGLREFTMRIYRACEGKRCGAALPGDVIKFKIAMQSLDECSYCEGR